MSEVADSSNTHFNYRHIPNTDQRGILNALPLAPIPNPSKLVLVYAL